ncbi:MAG: hypothetical protein R6V01_01055 [Thermoplasmatota archaeon]
MRIKKLSKLTAIVVLLSVTISVFMITSERTEGQNVEGPMILNDTKLHMIAGMQLTPLAPENTDEWQAVAIPNGFIKDGLFGWNLLPIGHTYWKDVGTWSSEPLRDTINLGGKVTVMIFATREEGSGSVSSDFIFDIMRGSEPILTIESYSNRIQEGVDNKIEASGFFPAANDTTVESNTVIQLRIRARCNGGAILKFGSSKLDSGFTFGSNSLEIIGAKINQKQIAVEYNDAFMVPWTKLYTQVIVNGIIQPNTDLSTQSNTINRTREILWERENPPGDYELETSISYDPTGQNNLTEKFNLKILEPEVSRYQKFKDFLDSYLWIFILIVAIIILPWMAARWRKRVWKKRFKELPPHDPELSRSKKKGMWKKLKKERKAQRKKKKQENKEKREREREDGKFSLFSKPPDERRGQRKSSRPPIQAEVLSEPSEELEL